MRCLSQNTLHQRSSLSQKTLHQVHAYPRKLCTSVHAYPRKHCIRRHVCPIGVTCWVSWEGIVNSILNRFLQNPSFRYLLSFTFATFFIHWPLSPGASSGLWSLSGFVCSGLTLGISKKCCVFAHCYTLDDDSECPMDYELSLLPKDFPTIYCIRCHSWIWLPHMILHQILSFLLFSV